LTTSPRPLAWWLWWLLTSTTVLSVVGFAIAAWLLNQKIADPPRASISHWQDTELAWAGGNQFQSLSVDQTLIFTSPFSIPPGEFSWQGQALWANSSDALAAWGIWLDNGAGAWLIVAINAGGYVTARLCEPRFEGRLETCRPLQEPTQKIYTFWRAIHFIRPPGKTNRLHLDYLPDQWSGGLSLRLNGEWMWDLAFQRGAGNLSWGLWARGGSETGAAIRWVKFNL
jgi:hypothetical protein